MQDLSLQKQLVAQVMTGRRSIRQFLDRQLEQEQIIKILLMARYAPSGSNIQPWRVHVVSGRKRDELCERVCQEFDKDPKEAQAEYDYYPKKFVEPYLSRRRKAGWALYDILGITKGDYPAMRKQHRRNFQLFDAPVALVITLDRSLAQGSWLDCGMFLQNILLAATAHGLGSCIQAAWIDYYQVVGEVLGFEPHEQLLCTIALGYGDEQSAVNALFTERSELENFVCFHND